MIRKSRAQSWLAALGRPNAMYAQAGLDAKGIVAKVFEALGKDAAAETVRLA